MPELPEVETVCRVMRSALVGVRVVEADVTPDPIVFSGHAAKDIQHAFVGRVVTAVGRRGKYFWLELGGRGPHVLGHLGMSGWVREVGGPSARLQSQGAAPLDDAAGRPRFAKLRLVTEAGRSVVYTDPRRFGRLWLAETPEEDPRIAQLGPDAFDALPKATELAATFARRSRAVKAVLLDQTVLAGIGNWIADEVLYQAGIAPARSASSLGPDEIAALRRAIQGVLRHAVRVGADHERFPKHWLFEHRWGGDKGSTRIGRHAIVREVVGGRTTAWVPSRQR